MTLQWDEEVRPTFGGHEKFVFRNGWLKKGLEAVREDPLIFTRDEALVSLGVGKNMVRSIRHWCLAMDLVSEQAGSGLAKPLQVSEFGRQLMLANAWDPYLEDLGSLWLIHWQLISNHVRALVWSMVFSAYFDSEFSKRQLFALVSKQVEQLGVRTTTGTLEREIDCVLRTYVPAWAQRSLMGEESLDCPLVELDLIHFIPEENLYRFNIGSKPSLPTAVFGYALFRFLSKRLQTRRTVSVEEILYQGGSPGQAFKLDENSLVGYLEQLEQMTASALRINETSGLRQIYLNEDIALNLDTWSYRLLEGYYAHD